MIVSDLIVKPDDTLIFDYVSTDGLELDYAKVDLDAYLLPCIVKDEPSTFNLDSWSGFYRFA